MANPAVDTDFEIGTTSGSKATLASLGVPNPHPVWKDAQSKAKLGNNAARYLGSPQVEWQWGFLTAAQRDTLRTYCTGASADVFITTPTTNASGGISNVAVAYEAQMWWPSPEQPEDPMSGRRLNFVIVFKQLVTS